jgi:hypothetical protein
MSSLTSSLIASLMALASTMRMSRCAPVPASPLMLTHKLQQRFVDH